LEEESRLFRVAAALAAKEVGELGVGVLVLVDAVQKSK
jgi:hypothetical protein